MTHAEADAEVRRRNDDPSEEGFWVAQRVEGDEWRAVHADAPGFKRIRATGTHAESKPRPPEPEDPRSGLGRNIPGYGG